jgi:hypothetical protein
MKFGWLCVVVLAGVLGLCVALPDKDEPASQARGPDLMRPLRQRTLREPRWRLSRLREDQVHPYREDPRMYDKARDTGLLFRRQADTDALVDKLLHIRRYHAPT